VKGLTVATQGVSPGARLGGGPGSRDGVGHIQGRLLPREDPEQGVMASLGHGRAQRARRTGYARVVRLVAAVDRLHRIVDRQLHDGEVQSGHRRWVAGGLYGVLTDLVPGRDRVASLGGRYSNAREDS
jgi:hypothetical protein